MKRTMLSILFVVLAAGVVAVVVPAFAQDTSSSQDTLTVEVAGFSVAKPRKNDKYKRSMAFGLPTGTAVHFAVDGGKRYFIQIDKDNSRLEAFKDNQGTVLAKPSKASGFNSWLPFSPNISDDGNQVFLSVRSKKLPASGAKTLTVKGSLTFLAGKVEKTGQTTFKLAKGEEVKLGGVSSKIERAEKTDFGSSKVTLTFKSKSSFAAIRSVSFLDADGEEIGHQKMGNYSAGFSGNRTYGLSFGLSKDVLNKQVTVKVTYFSDVENVKINLDETVTLGL